MTPWAVAYAHRDTDPRKMRHLDLLALWLRLHPAREAGSDMAAYRLAQTSKETLADAILNGPA